MSGAGAVERSPLLAGTGTVQVADGATELKLGGLDLTAGTWENAGALTITNAGTITVSAGRFGADVPAGTFGTLTQSAGLTKVAARATLDKAVVLNGGTLSGPGTIRSIVNNGGTVEPGSSPGTLSSPATAPRARAAACERRLRARGR